MFTNQSTNVTSKNLFPSVNITEEGTNIIIPKQFDSNFEIVLSLIDGKINTFKYSSTSTSTNSTTSSTSINTPAKNSFNPLNPKNISIKEIKILINTFLDNINKADNNDSKILYIKNLFDYLYDNCIHFIWNHNNFRLVIISKGKEFKSWAFCNEELHKSIDRLLDIIIINDIVVTKDKSYTSQDEFIIVHKIADYKLEKTPFANNDTTFNIESQDKERIELLKSLFHENKLYWKDFIYEQYKDWVIYKKMTGNRYEKMIAYIKDTRRNHLPL
jgi:hypothetical protein